jgi:hypothetical protein
MFGSVSAADTVSIRLFNTAGGNRNLSNATFRVRVTKQGTG